MFARFRRTGRGHEAETDGLPPQEHKTSVVEALQDGDEKYVRVQAENDSPLSYQDASGAPVETKSPLGLSVGSITIVFLNLSKMVGTGIFSTRKFTLLPIIASFDLTNSRVASSILSGTGSVGLALMYWFIGLLATLAIFSIYQEFAAYFPNRSGSEAVYLEQAYPRPRYLFPLAFAMQTVILSFSSGNSVVCANYLFAAGGREATDWETKGVAIAVYTIAFLLVVFNTRFSYLASNAIGGIKLITLIFIAITGLVVLGGHTSVEAPRANFRNAFEGQATIYGTTNAMIKIIFSCESEL